MATPSYPILKSKVKEYLTGRKFESLILPLNIQELPEKSNKINESLLYGNYPKVVLSEHKQLILSMLYNDYITKDIIEVLKIGKPDIMEKMLTLLAHSSGQIINENQISIDCKASNSLIQNYLSILENTYIIHKVTPFVGNKRAEITSRPKYYFIDNGFRNQALRNFSAINFRQDIGFLVESLVCQELIKYREQNYLNYDLNFWRTKSGAEVDFVISYNNQILPIEVKYQNFNKFTVSKSFRSFLAAYKSAVGIIITKNFKQEKIIDNVKVKMIPLNEIASVFENLPQA